MVTDNINKKEFKTLCKNIETKEVDRFGQYKYNGYIITIYEPDNDQTGIQRMKALYKRRKDAGLCVSCGIKIDRFVRCKKCRDKQLSDKKVEKK